MAGRPGAHQPEWPDEPPPRRRSSGCRRCRRSSSPARRASCRRRSAEVAAGRAFLLQAGDCAESFHDFSAVIDPREAEDPAADVGRDDLRLDAAGGQGRPHRRASSRRRAPRRPSASAASSCRPSAGTWCTTTRRPPRRASPDPERMVQAYHQSAATLNLLRAFTKGGFADLDACTCGTRSSSPPRRRASATSDRGGDRARARASWPRSASTSRATPRCTRSTSGRATRGSLLDYEEGLTRTRLDDRRLVRLLGAHALDRRAHPAARRRARRVLLGRPQPDRLSSSGRRRRRRTSSSSAERLNPRATRAG